MMRPITRMTAALRGWFRPDALDRQVSEELRFHLERLVETNIEAGMSPQQARQAAHLALGSVEAFREQSRAGRPGALMHQIGRDLAFGIRLLRRAPGFTVTGALVVALGIGTTTAIFSVIYGVMLRPLPYPEPDRLVALWSRTPGVAQRVKVNPADQRALRSSNGVFEDIALANAPQNFNLIGAGDPERLLAARLSSSFFSVLRVSPALGRPFTADDEQRDRSRVVLLSHGLWTRRFAADPSVVGRSVNLSGETYEIVGVMRPDFQFPDREHQLWIPLTLNPRVLSREVATYDHFAIARLKPGVSLERARDEINVLAAHLEAAYPGTNRGVRLDVLPLLDEAIRPFRPALYVLVAAVFCLLLIACLNLASLLGSRAASRTREFAVRLALGASPGRLALQAFAEVIPLLALGGILGIAGATFAIAAFVPVAPAALPRLDGIAVNGPVLTFSMALLLLTGVVAGILPAIQAWHARRPAAALGARAATGGRGDLRMRNALVVAQLALTLPLLVGATALARSFAALIAVEPGFRPENVLSLHMAIPRSKYRTDGQIAAFCRQIVDDVRALPGVVSAGMVNRLPLTGNDFVLLPEFERVDANPGPVQSRSATPEYFRTMGIPLHEGREFTEADSATAPLVSVIDARLARRLWPGQSAIGRRFRVALPGQPPRAGEIVGVVGAIRHRRLESEDDAHMYFNYHQFTDGRIALVVRSQANVRALTPVVLERIRTLDAEQPVYDVRTMDDVRARSTAQRWLNMAIIVVFAASSLVLSAVGLYGVIAYGVTQRVREFGVRLALGAVPREVSRLVLRNGSILAGCGIALGLGAAIALARGMESLVYGVSALDPLTFGASTGLLLAVALAASYVPSRRAALSDPAQALRGD